MRARALFFQGALAFCVFSAVVFTAGWLWYEPGATEWNQFIQGQLGDQSDDGRVAENRYLSDTCLLLLKIVPMPMLAAWFVLSWIVFGRNAFRLETIKSHFSALK